MKKVKKFLEQSVEKQERKAIIKPGGERKDYWKYGEEAGRENDWWRFCMCMASAQMRFAE